MECWQLFVSTQQFSKWLIGHVKNLTWVFSAELLWRKKLMINFQAINKTKVFATQIQGNCMLDQLDLVLKGHINAFNENVLLVTLNGKERRNIYTKNAFILKIFKVNFIHFMVRVNLSMMVFLNVSATIFHVIPINSFTVSTFRCKFIIIAAYFSKWFQQCVHVLKSNLCRRFFSPCAHTILNANTQRS